MVGTGGQGRTTTHTTHTHTKNHNCSNASFRTFHSRHENRPLPHPYLRLMDRQRDRHDRAMDRASYRVACLHLKRVFLFESINAYHNCAVIMNQTPYELTIACHHITNRYMAHAIGTLNIMPSMILPHMTLFREMRW